MGAFLGARLSLARLGQLVPSVSVLVRLAHTSVWSSRIPLQMMVLPMVILSDARHATWNLSLYSPADAV